MKYIKLRDAEIGQNSDNVKTLEYSFGDESIDLGVATIEGRFPKEGYAYNEVSKELIYVLEGTGTLNYKNESLNFSKGDAILIMPKDRYYFETKYALITMACTPSWNPSQHKIEK